MTPGRDELLNWVERVSMYLAAEGVPPMAGRILGWLMVCDPPEQSAGEICEAIGASRASLTTNMRVLITMGFVVRSSRPGQRTAFYRVDRNAWERVVQRQIDGMTAFLDITRDGLDMFGARNARAERIREAQEVFDWMAKAFDNAPPPPSTTRKNR
ncbi:GbsR/MarR family transcriptional regulator [Kibdelosporangium aridum]|uniref:MarR family protein n=1 Tax=Kibdelosporangium aridum TaxID=2030 RepID=A0A1Y5Y5N4_KIBAR|nr:MarR family transcriptional regulator [Kibdelosporangium aridum]SMD25437.1 MarR family protein [Kibdelosporangium aridum]